MGLSVADFGATDFGPRDFDATDFGAAGFGFSACWRLSLKPKSASVEAIVRQDLSEIWC